MGDSMVPFKIYLIHNDSDEPEVRRFGILASAAGNFHNFSQTVTELFPSVANKVFKIYWEDEDGDKVYVSSDAEFSIALNVMNSGARKFYLKTQSHGSAEDEYSALHPGVYCDGCKGVISGFRYKCLMCRDYDLCKACEQADIHAEHTMLRIPHPLCVDRKDLHKLVDFMGSSIPMRAASHRKRHSYDTSRSDSHRKKRSEKRDGGHETGDEMDESSRKQHSHKKCRKQCTRPLASYMMDYFNPVHFESKQSFCPAKKTQEEAGHMTYLKTIAMTIQKMMDPLGVNVEFEVRPKGENKEEGKPEEKKKEEEAPQGPSTSAPAQKEVRFASPQEMAQAVQHGIEEITKTLANQTMNNGNTADDGWVSFEELKRDSEGSQTSGSVESIPSTPQQEESATQTEKTTPGTSSQTQKPERLYPPLDTQELSRRVQESLDKMLEMGFTNEDNWLEYLLKAKKGNINLTLEALDPSKKFKQ